MSLAPPPVSRSRASSTTLRPAFTLASLGRRRSSSCLNCEQQPATPPNTQQSQPPSPPPPPSPSMLILFASRFLEWLHLDSKQHRNWSTSSSPRSSEDDFVLPLSASAQKTTFGDVLNEKDLPSHTISHSKVRQLLPSAHTPILLVILLLPISTGLVLLSLSTLPISLAWPRTLADVAQMGRELHGYSQSGLGPLAHVVGVMAITAVWKHAWSIPGSVVWNVLAGALFSPAFATILLTVLTTIGSLCASLLSKPLAPILTHFFPRALDITRHAIEGDNNPSAETTIKTPAWVRLSILRLIGVVPWSGINIACGVTGVAIGDCLLGAFIGSLPWTAVTCQIGDILQTLASTPSPTPQTISSVLTSPAVICKLVFLSFLSLAPILLRDKLRSWVSQSSPDASTDKPTSRWVQDWRTKIRLLSRFPSSTQQQQLAILIEEKRTLEDLAS
ncbi:hypothetical protein AX16_003186 [Volvariella volvacea WC 439]|nr:hypothetical protein AX16_003186 [Volvariella volvacea WC 439]